MSDFFILASFLYFDFIYTSIIKEKKKALFWLFLISDFCVKINHDEVF